MSANENVQDRTPDTPVRLSDVAGQVMDEARSSDSGNAALTLTPAASAAVKQTVVAVRSGGVLGPDHWNGPATIQVLQGRARSGDDTLGVGDWTVIGAADAEVSAEDDVVLLLTVAPHAG